ncbi:3-keto-disaccharide hydrolase [Frigoriglobus tundricola]|uniref:Beta-jelly-roll-type glycoside hydrolase n=1 Tax=Frigoriglobus tundricola TaxID=2774151 RepID=A0A6M5YIJ0_9BACT|nr:DUF1080 domain-containing protein [Frigoriglobus tundricola]QJW93076.1 beta-jelly-roll-type glycoside hydrolase [Frigoriglobus tundricola]
MLRLLAACVALAVPSPVFAEEKDKPKPNTLTPKEIADGWILLFDGETTFGWKIEGTAEVKDGVLMLPKGKKTTVYPTALIKHYEVSFDVIGGALIYHTMKAPLAHAEKIKAWDTYTIRSNSNEISFGNSSGDLTTVGGERPDGAQNAPICIVSSGDSDVKLRSIKLRPLETKALFTGKNLDGWKVNAADPKRMASKWEVTKDGELSVKNGPGDLVSEKEFDNFVLQLECKTLGAALNSGVFFRCVPGQYQNGYEAQIQNAFKEDRTKPLDFGTGAIYRRVPARKVVSNDNEWFTMTVAADGKHISTWVNGYQTVDWTDERKESDNPRQGYRAAKGPLSIQGHDPTTDILFRNIRIAPLP